MQRSLNSFAFRVLIGLLLVSMAALTVHGQQTTIKDAAKSAYDFDSLSGVIDADQVDYFSGNWSYVLPLGDVEGAGGLSLPIRMRYSSAVTGTDRLIKLGTAQQISSNSKGTVTLNNAGWVGLGWNLEFGAIKVTGGYEMKDTTSPINHPFSFNLSLVLPDGSHRLVRQLDDSERTGNPGEQLPATNVYYAENRKFMDIRWNFDRNAPLASTWTVKTVSGLVYTFGAVTIEGKDYGMNQTVKGGTVQGSGFKELMPEMVYQWNLAEIRDQAGNSIRFRYGKDGPVTTVRDWARERAEATRSFRNLLDFADLDKRFPGGILVGMNTYNLTVVKTFNTGHLDEAIFSGADGEVVRRITTETSAREDVHVARHQNVVITYDNYFDPSSNNNDPYPYGHYLVRNNHSYRMNDGISSSHRLDALKVTDAAGNQVARYTFRFEDDKNLQARPPVAPGDNTRTLLLEGIGIMGTGNAAGDNLPPYRFTNNLSDSHRITKVVTPTGGEMTIDYENMGDPEASLKYDDAYFDRSRRIKYRIWDADGAGPALPDTTEFKYVRTAPVMDIIDSSRVRRVTFPVVDEILPGRHGKIRRDFVGEADLDALGLSARDKQQESERNIRRGLLEEVTYHDASGGVVQRDRTDWQVTTQGTWTGEWQRFYHPGIPQQAYWLRAGETTITKDGVSTTTLTSHNARNGLAASQTLKSGAHTLRVTDTSYHGDQVTSNPVTVSLKQPVLDRNISEGDGLHAAFLEGSSAQTAKVEAFVNANSRLESTGQYDFASSSIDVSNYDALRLKGLLRTSAIHGRGLMVASWHVTVRWDAGGSSLAEEHAHTVSVDDGPIHFPVRKPFDVVIPVPKGASTAVVNVRLNASVRHPEQSVYRKIGITASNLQATGLSADDPESVLLDGRHILNRPHVVTVKDGFGNRLQATKHRYGRFNERGTRIVMPDTTSVWLDRNGDGQVDTGEWIDQQVATDYDAYGNLIEARNAHGTVTSTIMGYDGMRPTAAFTGASAAGTAAVVFDDHGSWTGLTGLSTGAWSKTGTGTPVLDDGALVVNDAVVRRDLPANASGVFEIDVMVESENEQTAIALAGAGRSGTDRIRWVFDADGTFKALSGTTLTATGASYSANQWHRVKIQWSGTKWWARVDGVRYPALGDYTLASGGIAQVKLSNGASSAGAAFDNLRTWPSDAQPASMTTWDPVTLDAIAVTDPNGHTTRFLRDGLRRVVQTIDGAGRITAQRDHRFSRGISGTSAYNPARPNRQADIAYPSRDGHKDLSADGHRSVTRGTGDRIEEGVSLSTAGAYVVADGEDVVLKGAVRVRLTRGFKASAGAGFRAMIDPRVGGNRVTGSGAVSYNEKTEGKRSVKLAPGARLESGRVSGHVTARADFHPASPSSGRTVVMAFEDGDDYVRMAYDGGSVKLESSIGGNAASSAFVPGYSRSWPWARVEMELLPSGKVNAWLYGHETTRFKGAAKSVSVPANWSPLFKSEGSSGNGYLAGRVSRLVYPDGSQARYAYDDAGRLTRVWDERGKDLARYTHTAAGNINTHTVGHVAGHGVDDGAGGGPGDGIATGTFTYNPREWVTGIDYPGRFTVNQTYDATGNVTTQRYRRDAPEALRTASYTYDRLHRLTYFNLAGARKTRYYEYDRNGNLSRMLTNGAYTLYRYPDSANPNRVSDVYGGGPYIRAFYNENGWVTSLSRTALAYDYRGLLTGHGSAAYTMDPDRRRVKKTAGMSTTYYLRGADGSVLAEYDGSQAMTARYVYAGGRRIARIAGGSASYYLADHLGSTRSLVGEGGAVTAAYDYWPYGKILATSGAETTHFRFTGHERDAESGLDYMLERSYAFNIGRFLRPDPMQDEYPGISPYAYANNNPLKYVDPDGNLAIVPSLVGAASGAVFDIAIQVAVEGRSLEEIDLGSVVLSATTGAVGVGVLSKLKHLSTAALYGTETAIAGAASASHQLYETGEVDPIDTGIDAAAAIFGGRASTKTSRIVEASTNVQTARRQADRYERIAGNARSESGARRRTERANRLTDGANNRVQSFAVLVGSAVSQAGSHIANAIRSFFEEEEE